MMFTKMHRNLWFSNHISGPFWCPFRILGTWVEVFCFPKWILCEVWYWCDFIVQQNTIQLINLETRLIKTKETNDYQIQNKKRNGKEITPTVYVGSRTSCLLSQAQQNRDLRSKIWHYNGQAHPKIRLRLIFHL